jgi:hypothetical protein
MIARRSMPEWGGSRTREARHGYVLARRQPTSSTHPFLLPEPPQHLPVSTPGTRGSKISCTTRCSTKYWGETVRSPRAPRRPPRLSPSRGNGAMRNLRRRPPAPSFLSSCSFLVLLSADLSPGSRLHLRRASDIEERGIPGRTTSLTRCPCRWRINQPLAEVFLYGYQRLRRSRSHPLTAAIRHDALVRAAGRSP